MTNLELLNALNATIPNPETIPVSISCGPVALEHVSAAVRKVRNMALYDYSKVISLPIVRDLGLPADTIEVRNAGGRVIQRFDNVTTPTP